MVRRPPTTIFEAIPCSTMMMMTALIYDPWRMRNPMLMTKTPTTMKTMSRKMTTMMTPTRRPSHFGSHPLILKCPRSLPAKGAGTPPPHPTGIYLSYDHAWPLPSYYPLDS
jgi:hypothetical protein